MLPEKKSKETFLFLKETFCFAKKTCKQTFVLAFKPQERQICVGQDAYIWMEAYLAFVRYVSEMERCIYLNGNRDTYIWMETEMYISESRDATETTRCIYLDGGLWMEAYKWHLLTLGAPECCEELRESQVVTDCVLMCCVSPCTYTARKASWNKADVEPVL